MGGKREYTAIFSIGGKLLGSFRGAMALAQARMSALRASVNRVGGALKGLKFMFGGLIGTLGGFFLGKIFSQIFGTASEEALQAQQRTRSLLSSLMIVPKYRKAGEAAAKAQIDLIYKHNKALEAQGVIQEDLLNNMAVQLSLANLSPGAIQDTTDVMQNMLIKWKGITASEEDATALGDMWRKALTTKKFPLELAKVLNLTRAQTEALKKMLPDQRQAEMLKYGKRLGDLNKQARTQPGGPMMVFRNTIKALAQDIGEKLLPAQDELAKAWTTALPEIGPLLVASIKGLLYLITQLGITLRTQIMPWWREFQKSERFKQIQNSFKWIQDHAKQIAIAVGLIVAALVGLNALVGLIGIITALASPVGLIVIAIMAVVAAIVLMWYYWDQIKAAFPAGAHVIEAIIQGWKLQFQLFIDTVKAIWATLVALFTGDWSGVSAAWKKVWQDMVATFEWAKGVVIEIAKAIGQAFKDYFLSVFEDIKSIWTWMKGFSWEGIKGAFGAAAAAAPEMQGSPYQHGGVITRPTMAMMGERGPEAVIPLSGGPRAQGLLGYANRALGMSPTTAQVNFAPVITINGNATESEQRALDLRLRTLARDFVDNFKRAQTQERRLSYESGYG